MSRACVCVCVWCMSGFEGRACESVSLFSQTVFICRGSYGVDKGALICILTRHVVESGSLGDCNHMVWWHLPSKTIGNINIWKQLSHGSCTTFWLQDLLEPLEPAVASWGLLWVLGASGDERPLQDFSENTWILTNSVSTWMN